ncbi:fibronectin type III domain-containing protein [Weeksellaceae bacterium TAE3-ERU29]|nr:fibronectin type III domain-containing protein [Weeksellaceae bacterium TAE3-ERU29]
MKKQLLILFCITLFMNKVHSQTNWELLNPKPTASVGKDIEFVTSNAGYIITSNELLETIDAGNTWSKKQNISSGNDMSFYNTAGYIVGDHGYVLKSIDNGNSWSQISTGFDGNFNTVNIIDDENIILSTSNSIVKTDNGGATWRRLNISNYRVRKTFFTGSLVGHAVCSNGIVLKTIDGGRNWYVTKDDSNTTPSNYFMVYFVNKNIGFATREHSEMYKTTDAGETWVKITGTDTAIYDFHFIDENNGFATGDAGATYKTTDGGNTWDKIFFQKGYISDTSMYGIYFQDRNIGYATGARGRIVKTIDGGNTWVSYSENYNDFDNIKVFDSGIGFARSRNNYYKTTDFGDNWFYLSSVNHYSHSTGLYFVNEKIGYSIGGGPNSNSGDIFKTTDGGKSWKRLSVFIDEGISSVFFIDENTGFISGGFNQNKLIKTTDGGNTWKQIYNQKFKHLQFLNEKIGYGIHNGNLYKTIDGGNTWSISLDVENKDIVAFDFINENNGYSVGDEGLIYKTTDRGADWIQLKGPYENYTKISFYSENVGYIADEDGKLYKTENGGLNWEYLTRQYVINSIDLVDNKIYTAGTNGKIFRSNIEYRTIVSYVNPAENITNSSATITGNITSNGGTISNIQFEYSTNQSFDNFMTASASTVDTSESLSVSVDLKNLEPNTTYYYRLSGKQNSSTGYSQILSFKTLPDYEMKIISLSGLSRTTAVIYADIISNEHDITNIEIQYGTSADALNKTIRVTPDFIKGNTTESVRVNLNNLEPDTQYYCRIKAIYQGENIYGDILSFSTYPDYKISLYPIDIEGANVTLLAHLQSNNESITDIVFEYGTTDYKNSVPATPSRVNANHSKYVTATIPNIDTSLNYRYRLKATYNGEAIYSVERVFNFSEDIIIVDGTMKKAQSNSIELRGLINSYGRNLTDVHFEYGVTDSFGSTIIGTPNEVYNYNTNLITALINNLIPNQTYYYRLVATHDGRTIYSDTYKYTTGGIGLKKEISIYPNPATDFVNIKSNISEKIKSIEFYNVLGQLIYSKNIFNIYDTKINVSDFKKGVYFIKANFENTKPVSSELILN